MKTKTSSSARGANRRFIEKAQLDAWEPACDTDYLARLHCPEFTVALAVYRPPYFAHIVIELRARKWLLGTKSLTLYLFSSARRACPRGLHDHDRNAS